MRIGAVFPHHDFGNEPEAITSFVRGVEELGFDHIVAYDHVLGASHENRGHGLDGPYNETHRFHEVLVLFGYLAAISTTLELVVGVLVSPQRQTALIAKQAAEVQLLSGGRLRLGLGTGWNWVEYGALGADFDRRGAVLDDQTSVLRALWSTELVDIDTAHHNIARAGINPLPSKAIPLWFGGYSTAAYRRSALRGDGHIFGHIDERTGPGVSTLRNFRAEAGLDPSDFGLETIADIRHDPRHAGDAARNWRALGGTHLSLRTMPSQGYNDPRPLGVDEHLDLLASAIKQARNY